MGGCVSTCCAQREKPDTDIFDSSKDPLHKIEASNIFFILINSLNIGNMRKLKRIEEIEFNNNTTRENRDNVGEIMGKH